MLKIWLGEMEDSIYNTSMYFDNTYEDSWITSEFSKRVIENIDKSIVKDVNCIESPILGLITPTQLSGGTKTLILMEHDTENIFNASTCGDNCAKWIVDIARRKDLTINLRHIMSFRDIDGFEAEILNNGKIVKNMLEFIDIADEYV